MTALALRDLKITTIRRSFENRRELATNCTNVIVIVSRIDCDLELLDKESAEWDGRLVLPGQLILTLMPDPDMMM